MNNQSSKTKDFQTMHYVAVVKPPTFLKFAANFFVIAEIRLTACTVGLVEFDKLKRLISNKILIIAGKLHLMFVKFCIYIVCVKCIAE